MLLYHPHPQDMLELFELEQKRRLQVTCASFGKGYGDKSGIFRSSSDFVGGVIPVNNKLALVIDKLERLAAGHQLPLTRRRFMNRRFSSTMQHLQLSGAHITVF